jgi:HAD superfamily hydrolase (TIGR01509 family)
VADLRHRPEAVLLDLDGTLVDTERLWQRAYHAWAATHEVALPDRWWAAVVGTSVPRSIELLAPHRTDLAADVQRVVAHATSLLREADGPGLVAWRLGARELLAALDAAGIATAVVTSSPRALLDAIVDHLGIEVMVTVAGDEVERGKPDPEGYLAAAGELEVSPEACVVIEDSPTGVAAAEAARMRVLAVPAGVPVAATPSRRVLASLVGVDLGVLAALPSPATADPS